MPPPGMPPATGAAFFGASATAASVVIRMPATEAVLQGGAHHLGGTVSPP